MLIQMSEETKKDVAAEAKEEKAETKPVAEEAPKEDAPKAEEDPKVEEAPAKAEPKADEAPKAKKAPAKKAPKVEAPAEEAPKAKAPVKEEVKEEAVAEDAKQEVVEEKPAAPAPSRRSVEDDLETLLPEMSRLKFEERGGEKFVKLEDLEAAEKEVLGDLADLEELYDKSLVDIKEQQIVGGRIIAISEKEVAVDIGFKSEGVVSIDEFDDPANLKVGDEIEVYLDSVEDNEGQLSLSKRKADFMRVWERVKGVYAADGIIRGRCTRRIKGGMVVDLGGVDAFLPGSQIDVRPVRDFDAIIGTEMEFKILKINDLRKNIVVSHKVLKEESLREVREKLLENLEVGQMLEGTVKNITDFGVFVDLGGVDGLLHITDLSWGRVGHPSEVVALDQKIKVMVLNYDPDRRRISLGLKQLYAHLWEEIDLKYRVGQKVQGRVVSLAKYGAFVEVEPGIEGLVHISEMSWTQHIKHPNQVVREGEYVQVVILNIDKDNKKISLGLKQVEEDPWEAFEAKYREGTKHRGVVRDLVPFGAFVELEDGIDGLVHISDLSWTRKVRHPGEILKKGEDIEVVVLSFDRDERRIALGHKQVQENPWDAFARDYPVNTKATGTVVRLIDKGLIIEMPTKIEGFMPNSQISRKYFDGKKRNVQVGDMLNLMITEFDKEERKVILSNAAVEKEQPKASASTREPDEKKSGARYGGGVGTTIGDTLGADLKAALERAKAEEGAETATDEKPAAKAKKAPKKAAAEPKAEVEAEAVVEEAKEATPEPEAEVEAEVAAEPEAEVEAEVVAEPEAEVEAEVAAEPEAEVEAEVAVEEEKKAEPEVEADVTAEAEEEAEKTDEDKDSSEK
jgi:small subunit ribosomal protein S1